MTEDPDQIILAPNAPVVDVYRNGWASTDRCMNLYGWMTTLNLPDGYTQGESSGNTCAAVLAPDSVTIRHFQSLHRCDTTGDAYALVEYPSVNIYGAGIEGSHGGSGMSAIGGTVRMGELIAEPSAFTDTSKLIYHALKCNIYAKKYLKNVSDATPGYRWPAPKADGYANDVGQYDGVVDAMEMGALLAIPKWVDVENMGLTTVPGKIIARTMKKYGAYIVDDTAWEVFAIETEEGTNGDVMEEFESHYGYPYNQQSLSGAWAKDIALIVEALHVVDNNTDSTIGGGPTPDLVNRFAPPACSFGTPGSGIICLPGQDLDVAVDSVSVSPSTITISMGESQKLTANIFPSNATNQNISWSTNDSLVVTVSPLGIVNAGLSGSAIITVTSQDGSKTATCEVIVNDTLNTNVYQAENYTSQSGCSVRSDITGFTGTGFVEMGGNGTYFEWNNVSSSLSASSMQLSMFYANGSTANRPCDVIVNSVVIGSITLEPTGDWAIWNAASINIPLNLGNNTVRITANSANGGPNLDKMELDFNPITKNQKVKFVNNEISIYPNPSSGGFVVQHSLEGACRLDISDIIGNMVKTEEYNENVIIVNEKLKAGIYLITISNKEKMVATKLIIR